MNDLAICGYGVIALLALLLLRVPVGVALGLVSFVGIWIVIGLHTAWGVVVAIPYDFVASWTEKLISCFSPDGILTVETIQPPCYESVQRSSAPPTPSEAGSAATDDSH